MKQPNWRPIVTAFVIWFVHFMVSWGASEIWPLQRTANAVAWSATTIALMAIGVHYVRLTAQHAEGGLPGLSYHSARGAIAIATVAVLFITLPSFVFLP